MHLPVHRLQERHASLRPRPLRHKHKKREYAVSWGWTIVSRGLWVTDREREREKGRDKGKASIPRKDVRLWAWGRGEPSAWCQ